MATKPHMMATERSEIAKFANPVSNLFIYCVLRWLQMAGFGVATEGDRRDRPLWMILEAMKGLAILAPHGACSKFVDRMTIS